MTTGVSWSEHGGHDCIRIVGAAGRRVIVRAQPAVALTDPPALAGAVVADGADACFVPRYAFAAGTSYAVELDGRLVAGLEWRLPALPPSTEVVAIHPTASEVPRNFLRLYIHFSAPMSRGQASGHIRLVDGDGATRAGALLPGEDELWDPERRRLTVLLDPGRIKRGLAPQRDAGYPLEIGRPFAVVIDAGFLDGTGTRLRAGADRRFEVGADERRKVEPERWVLDVPRSGTAEAFGAAFDRPLDHGLLHRCLGVVGPHGTTVGGRIDIGSDERSWRVIPDLPWTDGPYQLVVDPVLEDVCGNSVERVFDRDLDDPRDAPGPRQAVRLAFRPRERGRRA